MTKIEWTRGADGSTGRTWNPTLGCSVASPGCDNCYAAKLAHRGLSEAHRGLTVLGPDGVEWTGEVRILPERLDVPLRVRKPTTWFVDSMSDLFHPDVPMEFILRVWSTMSRAPQHTFQVLTKRPQRMATIVNAIAWEWEGDDKGGEAYAWPGRQAGDAGYDDWEPTEADLDGGGEMPLPGVWLGTSIESDRYAFRADHLRATQAAVRFLSLEPLLGPLPSLSLEGIDWVIAGGESGPGARPMHPDWVRDIRDRCVAAGVPFFFKQWGEWAPTRPVPWMDTDLIARDDGSITPAIPYRPGLGEFLRRVGKKAAGRELDGRTWDEMPEARS